MIAKVRLYAVGPSVVRDTIGGRHYVHDDPVFHRAYVADVGGVGEPNAGEFLIETPCGYRGWCRSRLNTNPDRKPMCEPCLNHRESRWSEVPLPEGAVAEADATDAELHTTDRRQAKGGFERPYT